MPWGCYVKIVLIWSMVVFFFCVPSILYALSTALPADNSLGLNDTTLKVFNQGAAVLVYLAIVIFGPFVAGWVVGKVTGDSDAHDAFTTRMVLMSRLMVGVAVPTMVTILFNNECLAWWLHVWKPCTDDSTRFNVSVPLMETNNIHLPGYGWGYYQREDRFTYQVTSHSQICHPAWKPHRCSRAVFSTVGNLILSKAALDAFLTPGAVMLMSMPFVTKPAERIWKRYYPEEPFIWYRGDVELSYILMFYEFTFIFGFIMPLLLPFMVAALLMNCAVYRCAVKKLKLPHPAPVRPPFEYLYTARMMGIAAIMWFYLDNDLNGQLLVCIGVPVCAVVGDYVAFQIWSPPSLRRASTSTFRTLTLPLLGPDEQKLQGLAEQPDNPAQDTYHPPDIIFDRVSCEGAEVSGHEDGPVMY